jgi:hypothetical protein
MPVAKQQVPANQSRRLTGGVRRVVMPHKEPVGWPDENDDIVRRIEYGAQIWLSPLATAPSGGWLAGRPIPGRCSRRTAQRPSL